MSARRRQETIARFSVPITEDTAPATQSVSQLGSTGRAQRRTRKKTSNVVTDDEDDVGMNGNDGNDSDFVAQDQDGDDSDFTDDEDADDRPKKKPKGKGKAKAQRGRATSSRVDMLDGSAFEDVNPKVMLISLKAGALGLNLTVANNVYL